MAVSYKNDKTDRTKKNTFGVLKLILKQGRAGGKLKVTSGHLPAKPPMCPAIDLPRRVISADSETGLPALEHAERSQVLIYVDRSGDLAGSLTRKLFDHCLF